MDLNQPQIGSKLDAYIYIYRIEPPPADIQILYYIAIVGVLRTVVVIFSTIAINI